MRWLALAKANSFSFTATKVTEKSFLKQPLTVSSRTFHHAAQNIIPKHVPKSDKKDTLWPYFSIM